MRILRYLDFIAESISNGIKKGVPELFHSRPKIAREIYLALGYLEEVSDNLDMITEEQKNDAFFLYSQYLNSITDHPIVYKGLRDKSRRVHDTPNHSYFTPNEKIAERWYSDERGVKVFVIPFTTSVDYAYELDNLNYYIRKHETDYINNAKEQLIRLKTQDIGGYQTQYVLNKAVKPLELGSPEDIRGFKEWLKIKNK